MGIKGTTAIIELSEIDLDDVPGMTQAQALAELTRFCDLNRFTLSERESAFDLFRRAAAITGEPVDVFTEGASLAATAQARRTHECMEAITSSELASGLAERAFDAAPGTHFKHDMREDACRLTNTCTNATATRRRR